MIQTKDYFSDAIVDYLQEESKFLPTKIEMNHFRESIEKLQDDLSRLEAKTNQTSPKYVK